MIDSCVPSLLQCSKQNRISPTNLQRKKRVTPFVSVIDHKAKINQFIVTRDLAKFANLQRIFGVPTLKFRSLPFIGRQIPKAPLYFPTKYHLLLYNDHLTLSERDDQLRTGVCKKKKIQLSHLMCLLAL